MLLNTQPHSPCSFHFPSLCPTPLFSLCTSSLLAVTSRAPRLHWIHLGNFYQSSRRIVPLGTELFGKPAADTVKLFLPVKVCVQSLVLYSVLMYVILKWFSICTWLCNIQLLLFLSLVLVVAPAVSLMTFPVTLARLGVMSFPLTGGEGRVAWCLCSLSVLFFDQTVRWTRRPRRRRRSESALTWRVGWSSPRYLGFLEHSSFWFYFISFEVQSGK